MIAAGRYPPGGNAGKAAAPRAEGRQRTVRYHAISTVVGQRTMLIADFGSAMPGLPRNRIASANPDCRIFPEDQSQVLRTLVSNDRLHPIIAL